MRRLVIGVIGACAASAPAPNQPGPPGTWTCKQIVESCDSMCNAGMCLDACSNQGSQQGGSLHAALLQCAAVNRCPDDQCTRALCGPQVDACIADGAPLAPPSATPAKQRPVSAAPPPPAPRVQPQPAQTAAPAPAPAVHVPTPPAPAPVSAPPKAGDVTGEWTYGAKTAIAGRKPGTGTGGTLTLDSDGRFERATNVETTHGRCKQETFHYAIGAWKLDGATLVLTVKQASAALHDTCKPANNYEREDVAADERRAIHMPDPRSLELTDDSGDVQPYAKK